MEARNSACSIHVDNCEVVHVIDGVKHVSTSLGLCYVTLADQCISSVFIELNITENEPVAQVLIFPRSQTVVLDRNIAGHHEITSKILLACFGYSICFGVHFNAHGSRWYIFSVVGIEADQHKISIRGDIQIKSVVKCY